MALGEYTHSPSANFTAKFSGRANSFQEFLGSSVAIFGWYASHFSRIEPRGTQPRVVIAKGSLNGSKEVEIVSVNGGIVYGQAALLSLTKSLHDLLRSQMQCGVSDAYFLGINASLSQRLIPGTNPHFSRRKERVL